MLFATSTTCVKLLVYTDTIKSQLNQLRTKVAQKVAKSKNKKNFEEEIDQIQGGMDGEHERKL